VRAFLLLLCFPFLALAKPPSLLIEAELTPSRVYVGAEAVLKLRLLRARGVPYGTLRPPEMGEDADVSLLGAIKAYPGERDGIAYEIIERAHVIVPRKAGRLVVPGAVWEGTIGYEVYNKQIGTVPPTARGPATVLEVVAPPAGGGEPFLPARSLVLEESWSRDLNALSEGIPVTRTLVMRAEGLAAERLPRIEMASHSAMLVHHDQPQLKTEYLDDGMVGRRVQRIVLMPVGEGEVALPEVRVSWWDVKADSLKVAVVPGRTLSLNALIAPVAVVKEAPVDVPGLLQWLVLALAVLAAVWVWWLVRTRDRRAARAKLKAACRGNDARGARDALLEWSRATGAPASIVQAIRALQPVRVELAALDAALYGGRGWDGKAFWKAVRRQLRPPAQRYTLAQVFEEPLAAGSDNAQAAKAVPESL